MSDDRAPYDVEPQWSPERKEAFALYRDFGADRSLAAVAQALGKSKALMDRWSAEDSWVARCAAFDAETDRRARDAAIEERERIARMHASAIDSTITVLMQAPLALAEKITSGDLKVNAEESDPYALTRATEAAAKVLPALVNASRLVHGFSTSNVEVKATALDGKTPDELDAYLLGFDDGAQSVIEKTSD
jgi:hypothetical protein